MPELSESYFGFPTGDMIECTYGSFSEAAQIMWTFLAILFYSLKLGEKNVNESLSTEHTFCGHKQ